MNYNRELTGYDAKQIERSVILLYDRFCLLQGVYECRRIFFTKEGLGMEGLPPTTDALSQHTKRALYQVE